MEALGEKVCIESYEIINSSEWIAFCIDESADISCREILSVEVNGIQKFNNSHSTSTLKESVETFCCPDVKQFW